MSDTWLRSSMLARMVVVCVLSVVLMGPALAVALLALERGQQWEKATANIRRSWADAQTIEGPVLLVPVVRTLRDGQGKESVQADTLHLLPDTLRVTGALKAEVRSRGIYEAVLYNGRVGITGSFNLTDAAREAAKDSRIVWDQATIALGLSDLRGLRDTVAADWNGQHVEGHPGVLAENEARPALVFPATGLPSTDARFSIDLNLNGSAEFRVVPVGRQTTVHLESTWPSPGFAGDFLPDRRTVSPSGFSADWRVLEVNRRFPQAWIGNAYRPSATIAVRLLVAVDAYQQTLRALKYALLFIVLTFLAFLLAELLGGEILHPVHYSLVGLALVLFYLLLLALSEHVGFRAAYLLASLSALLLVVPYVWAIVSRKTVALLLAALLAGLYGLLYVLLQLEDYALLAGSLALLVILGVVMYLTRRIDWFNLRRPPAPLAGG